VAVPVIAVSTFKLILEYDGSRYHGWQVQPGLPTVQAEVQAAIRQIIQAPITVTAAGRTDAGVHALGQVVGFTASTALSEHDWLRAYERPHPSVPRRSR